MSLAGDGALALGAAVCPHHMGVRRGERGKVEGLLSEAAKQVFKQMLSLIQVSPWLAGSGVAAGGATVGKYLFHRINLGIS